MFFDDPAAAFANLASALAPGGRLAFTCWQELARNPFFLLPALAIAGHVALPDPPPPGAPGMFALADPARVRLVLAQAGLADVAIEPVQRDILLGGEGSLAEAVEFISAGPTARAALAGADARTRERALAAVGKALDPYASADGVRLGAAAWLVTARRPSVAPRPR
jgi:hypothetical protein